jgi:hypothetical protein
MPAHLRSSARWTSCKRQESRGQRRCSLLGSSLLVDREFKIGKPREAFFGTENAQARYDRARRKRRDGQTRECRGAHSCQTQTGTQFAAESIE